MVVNQKLSVDQIVTIYGTYVQTITQLESRRISVSTFFASLSAAIIAVRGYFDGAIVMISTSLLVTSIVWIFMILNYRKLSTAKFRVIEELEQEFSIKPFFLEAKYLKNKRYWGLSHLELFVPICLALLSGVQLACYLF